MVVCAILLSYASPQSLQADITLALCYARLYTHLSDESKSLVPVGVYWQCLDSKPSYTFGPDPSIQVNLTMRVEVERQSAVTGLV